jgi:UrcA family protein
MNSSVTHRFGKTVTALALGMTTALIALTAQAGEPSGASQVQDSVVVHYGDLNLATTAGAQALYGRISTAAERACGGEPSVREMRQYRDFRTCVDSSVERAVKKIDSERLQALHAERKSSRSVG